MIAVCCVLFVLGCNDEIKVENRTFKNLCQMSGGEIDPRDNSICVCFGKPCSSGIVCINNGEFCADSKDICDQGHLGDIICKNNSNKVGYLRECKFDEAADHYGFENFTPVDAETMNDYHVLIDGVCNGVSCNSNLCGECRDDDKTCRKAYGIEGIYTCQNGVWELMNACPGTSCKPEVEGEEPECGECLNNEERCVPGKGNAHAVVQRCVDGQWPEANIVLEDDSPFVAEICDTKSCDETGKLCAACQNEESRCIIDKNGVSFYYSCQNEHWTISNCPNDFSCQDGMSCGECRNNAEKCEDENSIGHQFICNQGKWEKKACKMNSQDVSCNLWQAECGACKNGETRCNDGLLRTCVHGEWGTPMECPGYVSCQSEELCGECSNGDFRCTEKTGDKAEVETCQKGKWGSASACATSSCDATNKLCAVCENGGESKCVNGLAYRCKNNLWTVDLACNSSCKSNTECGECYDGTTKCEVDEEGHSWEKSCTKGVWGAPVDCGDFACNSDGTACTECSEGKKRCVKENGVPAYEQVCVLGKWGEPVYCDVNACDKEKMNCATCIENQTQCVLNDWEAYEQKCKDGVWAKEHACGVYACNPDYTKCADCEHGQTQCIKKDDGALEQKCELGQWVDGNTCGELGCNYMETACAVCKPGETRCSVENGYAYEQRCFYGAWGDVMPCDTNECNAKEQICAVCKEKSFRCYEYGDDLLILACTSHEWGSTEYKCSYEKGCTKCIEECKKDGDCKTEP